MQLSDTGSLGMDKRGARNSTIQKALKGLAAHRGSVVQVPTYAQAYRASVLQFARQVSGTGLEQDPEPRQSLHIKHIADQVAEVGPVLQKMASARSPRVSHCFEPPDLIHEEIESLHAKMDQITESLVVLAREVGQTKSAMLYTATYNQVHRSGTLPGMR